MKRLFSSSELAKQRKDWHHALVKVEAGDKPYLMTDSRDYRTMRPGAYLVEMQRNRNNAPITYTWIGDANGIMLEALATKEPERAIDIMARLVA